MLHRALLLIATVAALAGTTASADTFYTLRAQATTPESPNVNQVSSVVGTSLGGFSYVNQYTSAGPPIDGAHVRVVSVDLLTVYAAPGLPNTPGNLGGTNTQLFVAVFAGNGQIAIDAMNPNLAQVEFGQNDGQLMIFNVDGTAAGFNMLDPTTWGLGSSAPFARYNLADPAEVQRGNLLAADLDAYDANNTNVIAVNTANPGLSQGAFIFTDLLDTYLNVTDASPFPIVQEGIIAEIQERISTTPTSSTDLLNLLNSLAGIGGLTDLGGVGTAFATGLGGGATQYNPSPNFSTGDVQFSLGATLSPGAFAAPNEVPEPASMAVWGIGMGVAGLIAARRRRLNAKK